MFKQKYGRPHRTYIGYRNSRVSGRCSKCSSLLSRVSKLPAEIKGMIYSKYKRGLRFRVKSKGYMRPKFRVRVRK